MVVLYAAWGLQFYKAAATASRQLQEQCLEARMPTPNPEIPQKTGHLRELLRKVHLNFSLLSCEVSQEPSRNCSEEVVQINFLFWVDFAGGVPPLNSTMDPLPLYHRTSSCLF